MQKLTNQDLTQFTGTENYYKSTFGGLKWTDGIKYLAEKGSCYWFLDILEGYQHELKGICFQIWNLVVNEDKTGLVTCKEDTDSPILVSQKLEYTDFPLKELNVYCIDGVVLLPSEY